LAGGCKTRLSFCISGGGHGNTIIRRRTLFLPANGFHHVPRQPAKRLSLCFARYSSMVQSILSLRKKVKINPLTFCRGALSESDLGRQHAQIF
jgi:hypothetical protein